MGFRKESYATVWEVEPVSDTMTKGRISISRKNKNTGEYETDFSGFVSFVGTASAKKASLLKEKDRIRLGDVDVTNRYDKKNGVTYTLVGWAAANNSADYAPFNTTVNYELLLPKIYWIFLALP